MFKIGMIKVNVIETSNDSRIDKHPYYIVLSKDEYNDIKTRKLEEIYSYFEIREKIQISHNVWHHEDIVGILSIKELDSPDYELVERTLAGRKYKIYKSVLNEHEFS